MTTTTIEAARANFDAARAEHAALKASLGIRRVVVLAPHVTPEQWEALQASAQRVAEAEAALLASERSR